MYISPDASPGDGLLGGKTLGDGSWDREEEEEEEVSASHSHVNMTDATAAATLDESNISHNPLIGMIPFRMEGSPEQRPVYRALSAIAITDDDSLLGGAGDNATSSIEVTEYVSSDRVSHRKMNSADSSCTDMSRSDLHGGNGREGGGDALNGVAAWRRTYISDADNTSARHLTLSKAVLAAVETPSKASVHFHGTHAPSSSSSTASSVLPSRSSKPSTIYPVMGQSSTYASTNMFHGLMYSGGKGAATSGTNEDISVSVRDMDVGNLSYDTMSFAADRLMAMGQSSVDMNNTEDLLKDIFGDDDDDDDGDSGCEDGAELWGRGGLTDTRPRPISQPPLPLFTPMPIPSASTAGRTFERLQEGEVSSDSESDSDDFNGVFRLP